MMNKRLGSSECQPVNPSNLFANQVNDMKCEGEGTKSEGTSFATRIPSKVPMVVGTPHRCYQMDRHATLHPAEEKHAVTSGSIRLMMFSKEIVHADAVHRKLKMLRYVE